MSCPSGPKTANVPRSEAKGNIDSRMSTENIYCFPKNPVTQSKKYYYVLENGKETRKLHDLCSVCVRFNYSLVDIILHVHSSELLPEDSRIA